VATWTVNSHDDMARVVVAGVHSIVSNRVGELAGFLGSLRGLGLDVVVEVGPHAPCSRLLDILADCVRPLDGLRARVSPALAGP